MNSREPDTIRIATWNLLHTAIENYESRLKEAIAQINEINPDVLLVQEATFIEGHCDTMLALSEECNLTVASRAEIKEVHGNSHFSPREFARPQVGILTRLPVLDWKSIPLPSPPSVEYEASLSVLKQPTGNLLIARSAHLAWGGAAESYRYTQARHIDAVISQEIKHYNNAGNDVVAVFGGDFNAVPESRTLRWLRGLEPGPDGHDTYWVDAWIAGGGAGEGRTSLPNNPHFHHSAQIVGISRPERNPRRRIDYILVRGWAHGRPGDPLRSGIFGDQPLTGILASDHFGVWADVADELPLPSEYN